MSDTRWSARYDAVQALSLGSKEHIFEICGEVRSEAVGLSKRLKELDNSILLQVWNMVLEKVYKTSVQLQKEGLSINAAVNLLPCCSLLEFIESYVAVSTNLNNQQLKCVAFHPTEMRGNANNHENNFLMKWTHPIVIWKTQFLHLAKILK